jgi:hypothetical protein
MITPPFPAPENWHLTVSTLHACSRVIGVVPRAFAPPHPKWWHISLKVTPTGLVTDTMPLPGGGNFQLGLDLLRHRLFIQSSRDDRADWDMTAGDTASQLAAKVHRAVAELGLQGDYPPQKYLSDEKRAYHPHHASRWFAALVNADAALKAHRATLPGEPGPVQLWTHGFDISFEWFGGRTVEFEEHGKVSRFPAQINLGFSPGEPSHPEPYFYSNPFPFEAEKLTHHPLPHGARWFTESWQGTLLPYRNLAGDAGGMEKLREYARAVFEIASPLLA